MTADTSLSMLPGVREAAEEISRERFEAWMSYKHGAFQAEGMWDNLDLDEHEELICIELRLLCDLSRPASRDWWVRWLAEKVGLTVGATAPEWASHDDPNGRWWRIRGAGGEVVFFVSGPHPAEPTTNHGARWVYIPGISTLTDPRAALAAACLAVGGSNG
jgi:hypothetical protein